MRLVEKGQSVEQRPKIRSWLFLEHLVDYQFFTNDMPAKISHHLLTQIKKTIFLSGCGKHFFLTEILYLKQGKSSFLVQARDWHSALPAVNKNV